MKKVIYLKEKEVIVCRSEQESKEIRQLMHDAGLKWCTGESYIEINNYFNEVVYEPYSGTSFSLKFAEKNNYIIHEAKVFLVQEKEQEKQQPNTIILPLVNGVPDISNCGVDMLGSNDRVNWYECKVYSYNSNSEYKYESNLCNFKFIKQKDLKQITRKEAENLLNNEFEIVD